MPIIKTVTNGSRTLEFKAISLGHAIAIFFGMASIIGGMFTWNLAIITERSTIIEVVRSEIFKTNEADNNANNLAHKQMFERIAMIEAIQREHERQITRNTEKLDHVSEAWKK